MKVLVLLFALLVANAVNADSPIEDDADMNKEVVEFESGPDDAVFDDENMQDSTEMDENDNDPDDMELLEEDAEVKDPINVMSWYCKFCKVCKACGNNCRSRYFRMACGKCKYCRWSFYRNLIRRIRIRLPRIRLRRIRLRRIRLPRIRLRRVRLPRVRFRRVRLPRIRLRRVRLPRIRLRRVRLPRVRVPRVRWGRRLRRWG